MNVTLSIPAWEAGYTPPKAYPAPILPKPPTPHARLAKAVFSGTVTLADMPYLAAALLQLSDENYELRQRIIALEKAVKIDRGGDVG